VSIPDDVPIVELTPEAEAYAKAAAMRLILAGLDDERRPRSRRRIPGTPQDRRRRPRGIVPRVRIRTRHLRRRGPHRRGHDYHPRLGPRHAGRRERSRRDDVSLNQRDVRAALFGLEELRRTLRGTGISVPTWLHRVCAKLDLEMATMSAIGHELDECDASGRELAPELLTVSQVAARLGKSERQVRRLAETGRIPANRIGRPWMFDPTTVDRWRSSNAG
jgi:excisionase family DNA binding protein